MAKYVWCGKTMQFVDKRTREPMPIPHRDSPQSPMIISDIQPHMFGDTYIGSRSSQRELAKTKGYVPFERVSKWSRRMPKAQYDEKNDNWQQFMSDVKDSVAKGVGSTKESVQLEQQARKAKGSLKEKVKPRAVSFNIE